MKIIAKIAITLLLVVGLGLSSFAPKTFAPKTLATKAPVENVAFTPVLTYFWSGSENFTSQNYAQFEFVFNQAWSTSSIRVVVSVHYSNGANPYWNLIVPFTGWQGGIPGSAAYYETAWLPTGQPNGTTFTATIISVAPYQPFIP